jgi:hypothetical protein
MRVSLYNMNHAHLYGDRNTLISRLDEYKVQHGRYPNDLSELHLRSGSDEGWAGFTLDENRRPIGPWNAPYVYKPKKESYELWSLGHDAQEGGSGFDADIFLGSSADTPIEIPAATIQQFTLDPAAGGVRFGCALAGLFTSIVGLVTIRGSTPFSPARLVILSVTVLMSVVIAALLAALHIPSGH